MLRLKVLLTSFCAISSICLTGIALADQLSGREIVRGEWRGQQVEYLAGQFLVGIADGADAKQLTDRLADWGCRAVSPPDRFGVFVVETLEPSRIFSVLEDFNKSALVRFAEPNFVHRLLLTPNDPDFSMLWALNNTGQYPPGGTPDADIDAPEGWNYGVGDSVITVGVLDTGIPLVDGQLSHPDLDDPTRYLLGPNYISPGNPPMDDNGHGTHVTGTIAAETNNGIGIAGVNWQCRTMTMKVFNSVGNGSSEGLRSAIFYGADHGCQVLSYSGGGPNSQAIEEALEYANTKGTILCAAAGNDYHGSVSYPGGNSLNHPNVICVSSSDPSDQSSTFSSIGPAVTVAAPGTAIYSTFPNYSVYLNQLGYSQNYATLNGTSMATPHVSGLCALILGLSPLLAPDSVRSIVANSADDKGATGFDNEFGHGRINIERALNNLKNIHISHLPLSDTKDTINAYTVTCAISSIAPLIPEDLQLVWKTSGNWNLVTLQPAKAIGFYEAAIPAQRPGTIVSYYLWAQNTLFNTHQTAVNSFDVIDYLYFTTPPEFDSIGIVNDTIWRTFTITNDGNYTDTYSLLLSSGIWPTTIWNGAGSTQITSIGPLSVGQTMNGKLRVIIPPSQFNDRDSVELRIRSVADPTLTVFISCRTVSEGPAATIPHVDSFDSPTVNPAFWITNHYASVDSMAISPPTGGLALHLDADPSDGDTVISQVINASSPTQLNLYYAVQQGGKLSEPEIDDDLVIQYFSSANQWVTLKRHFGAEIAAGTFSYYSLPLPSNAIHRRLRVRFISSGQSGGRDNWFVDDFGIKASPEITVTTIGSLVQTLTQPQQGTATLRIANAGPAPLTYSVEVIPDDSPLKRKPRASDQAQTATGSSAPTFVKGGEEPPSSPAREVKGGGPDNHGYWWSSYNDATGPIYSWIDISATGTQVPGLADDNVVGPFPIGFAFPFYDTSYTEFFVSSNGLIGFESTQGLESPIKAPIPGLLAPNNFIALLWDDLVFSDPINPGGAVYYSSTGTELIIQFKNVAEYLGSAGDVFSGEIILTNDGTVRLQYENFATGFDRDHCTVGMEDRYGFDGVQVVYLQSFLIKHIAVKIAKRQTDWLEISPLSGIVKDGGQSNILFTYFTDVAPGVFSARIKLRSSDPDALDSLITYTATLTANLPFTVGDADGNGAVNLGDVVAVINYIFASGTPPTPEASGDVDCTGYVNISDAVYLISYIFAGGPAPCETE